MTSTTATPAVWANLFSAKQLEQFNKEVAAITRLNQIHGVIKVFDCDFLQAAHPFLVMQYVDGWHLEDFVKHECPVRRDRVQLVIDICDTLHVVHEQGILHRDIKPRNILIPRIQVGGKWHPVVADFGLAIDRLEHRDTGTIVAGTLPFMSPEQVRFPNTLTRRSDVYSVGVLLYWLLSEAHPYVLDLNMAHRCRAGAEFPTPQPLPVEKEDLGGSKTGVAKALAAIVQRALRHEPTERFQSARELGEALRQWLREAARPIAVALPKVPEPSGEVAPASHMPVSLAAVLYVEVANRSELRSAMGLVAWTSMMGEFSKYLRGLQGSRVIGGGDRILLRFHSASDAVSAALDLQWTTAEAATFKAPLKLKIGIDVGEVIQSGEGSSLSLEGLATDRARVLTDAALPLQILISKAVYDQAKQFLIESVGETTSATARTLQWLAHGPYRFESLQEEIDVYEVGIVDRGALTPPGNKTGVMRAVKAGDEEVWGWRPAAGRAIPGRSGWELTRSLGEGGFGDVWLAEHAKSRQRRVFKFCFDAVRLRSFKREIRLFKLLKEALGNRPDIAVLFEAQLETAPYFLESEYAELGNLDDWAIAAGGLSIIPLSVRLGVLAEIADAVAAAHSVDVLHQDIKPSNVLMFKKDDGSPRPRLADFGIGILTDRARLADFRVTASAATELDATTSSSHRMGTRMYAPPEAMTGKPFTRAGDVYALGVLLYQLVVGDFARPLAIGWERDVEDEILRADIADCVDGITSRRLGNARELADRLRSLDRRRAELTAARERQLAQAQETERQRAEDAVRQQKALLAEVEDQAAESRDRLVRLTVSTGVAHMDRGDYVTALLWFAESLRLDPTDFFHRFRVAILIRLCPDLMMLDRVPARVTAARIMTMQVNHGRTHVAITGTHGGNISCLDADAGTLLARGRVHGIAINALDASGAHGLIATACDDGTARVWEIKSNAPFPAVMRHKLAIRHVAFSPDGQFIVTSSDDKSARIWETRTGAPVGTPLVHGKVVVKAEFSPDGARILTASVDGTARLWDATTSRPIGSPMTHPRPLVEAGFSHCGRYCVTCSQGGAATIWLARNGARIADLEGHSNSITRAQFYAEGTRLMTACLDGYLRVFDVATGGPLRPTIKALGAALDFSLGRTERVLVHTAEGTARSLDAAAQRLFDEPLSASGKRMPRSAAGSSEPLRASGATKLEDHCIQLFNLESGRSLTPPLGHESAIQKARLCNGGTTAITVTALGVVRAWNMEPPGLRAGYWRHKEAVTTLLWSDDGLAIASCGLDGEARVYGGASLRNRLGTFQHPLAALDLDVSRYLERIAVATCDNCAVVHDLNSQTAALQLDHQGPVNSVCWHPDGRQLLTASDDGTIVLWDCAAAPRQIQKWLWASEIVQAQFSFDGQLVVALSADQMLSCWKVGGDSERPEHMLSNVLRFAVSRRKNQALAAKIDGILNLINLDIGKTPHQSNVRTLHTDIAGLAADESFRIAATFGDQGDAFVWDMTTREQLGKPIHCAAGISAIALSPDGAIVAIGGFDGSVRLLDVQTSEPLAPPTFQRKRISCLVFRPDGQQLAVAADDGSVVILEIPTDQRPIEQIIRHVQLLSGRRLDSSGNTQNIDPAELLSLFRASRKDAAAVEGGPSPDSPP